MCDILFYHELTLSYYVVHIVDRFVFDRTYRVPPNSTSMHHALSQTSHPGLIAHTLFFLLRCASLAPRRHPQHEPAGCDVKNILKPLKIFPSDSSHVSRTSVPCIFGVYVAFGYQCHDQFWFCLWHSQNSSNNKCHHLGILGMLTIIPMLPSSLQACTRRTKRTATCDYLCCLLSISLTY